MSAVISDCGNYRYELRREQRPVGPTLSIVMVNPSTADAAVNDATIRKLIGFSERLGWARFIVVNLFAYRATDVNELRITSDPNGELNNSYILAAMMQSEMTIAAWGSNNKLPPPLQGDWIKIQIYADALNRPLWCWGTCNDGHPRHPVMLGYDTPLIKWKAPT